MPFVIAAILAMFIVERLALIKMHYDKKEWIQAAVSVVFALAAGHGLWFLLGLK